MELLPLHKKFCEIRFYRDGIRPKTIRIYRFSMKLFMQETSVTKLEEVTPSIVEDFFIRGMRDRKWTKTTFNIYRKSLIPFFKWCVEKKYLAKKRYPFTHLRALEIKDAPKEPLSRKETRHLLESAYRCSYKNNSEFLRYRNQAVIGTLIYTGLRANELLGLLVGDINFENREIFVRDGKGGKSRTIPLLDNLEPILISYLEKRKLARTTCQSFFISYTLDKPFTYSGLRKLIKRLRDKSGIHFYAHQLRRTFITIMAESNCNKWALKEIAGHGSIKTTEKNYINVSKEFVKNESKKFQLPDITDSICTKPKLQMDIKSKLETRLLKAQMEQEILKELISNQ